MPKYLRLFSLILFFIFSIPFFCFSQDSNITMTTEDAKKVDFILLQDESGSMKKTDPNHLRKIVAATLIEDLEVAGEGNRMSIIPFGTIAKERIGLCHDFEQIMDISAKGFPPHTGLSDRKNSSSVPASGYTDIYGAIEAAGRLFLEDIAESSENNNRAKYVILLTDGKIDPWPGNEMRYGDTAAEYLKCLQNENHAACDHEYKNDVAAIDTERLFERGGILGTYLEKGWRIYCVGFSRGVDRNMLHKIAEATHGDFGIAQDLTQLLKILKGIIPKPQNVVTLYTHDFCDTRQIQETVPIENEIQAVLFKIDLIRMLENHTSVKPEDIQITLTDPSGTVISSADNQFRFNTTKDGLAVSAGYVKENPQAGDWIIRVEGARDLCGELKVTGRVPFVPEMKFIPQMSTYYGDDQVAVSVSLKNQDNNQTVPMRQVEGFIRFSKTGEDTIKESVNFTVSEDGSRAEANVRIPQNIKGIAGIETTIVDKRYGSKIPDFKNLNVASDRRQVIINSDPGTINFGIIGDDTYQAEANIKLTTPSAFEFKFAAIKPLLKLGNNKIPEIWVKVTPDSGRLSATQLFNVQINVEIPETVSLALPQGVYKGSLIIEPENAQMADNYGRIPVELELKIPEIIVEPARLKYDFKWRLGALLTEKIKIFHTSSVDRLINIELPHFFKNKQGKNQADIIIGLSDPDKASLDIMDGEPEELGIQLKLTNTELHKKLRIPPGTYRETIILKGPGMQPKTVDISVKIPKEPLILKSRPIFKWMTVGFGILTFIGIGFFINRCLSHCFESKHEISFDKHGNMNPKETKKFQCAIQRHVNEDNDYIFSMPGGVNNPEKVFVKDPDAEQDYIPFPDNGIDNIDDWKGCSLENFKTQDYSYKPQVQRRKLFLNVKKSPYGTKTGYFFRTIFFWFVLSAISACITYMIYQIV